jgi:hypothetical protein
MFWIGFFISVLLILLKMFSKKHKSYDLLELDEILLAQNNKRYKYRDFMFTLVRLHVVSEHKFYKLLDADFEILKTDSMHNKIK